MARISARFNTTASRGAGASRWVTTQSAQSALPSITQVSQEMRKSDMPSSNTKGVTECRVSVPASVPGQRRAVARNASLLIVLAPAIRTSASTAWSFVTTTTGRSASIDATSARSTSSASTPSGE